MVLHTHGTRVLNYVQLITDICRVISFCSAHYRNISRKHNKCQLLALGGLAHLALS